MKTVVGLIAAAALLGLASSAAAQRPPPGSYRESCWNIRMEGSVLNAVCRRARGRGAQRTALNVANRIGDIGNNDGNLVCSRRNPWWGGSGKWGGAGSPWWGGPGNPGWGGPGR